MEIVLSVGRFIPSAVYSWIFELGGLHAAILPDEQVTHDVMTFGTELSVISVLILTFIRTWVLVNTHRVQVWQPGATRFSSCFNLDSQPVTQGLTAEWLALHGREQTCGWSSAGKCRVAPYKTSSCDPVLLGVQCGGEIKANGNRNALQGGTLR